MPAVSSFDVTSTVDLQEVDNALNQAQKEVAQAQDALLNGKMGACAVHLSKAMHVGTMK